MRSAFALLSLLASTGISSGVQAQSASWSASIGAGALVSPEYAGSDSYKVRALPNFQISYGDQLKIDPRQGVRYNFFPTANLTLGMGVGIDFGRDQGASVDLNGLGDIDTTAEGKLYADYRFKYARASVAFAQDLAKGHGGYTIKPSLGTFFPIPPAGIFLIPSISTTYASEDYLQSYFGVTAAQSAASGLAPYTAESGFKDISANLVVTKKFDDKWSLNVLGGYTYLLDKAANSPIVKKRNQFTSGAFITYKF